MKYLSLLTVLLVLSGCGLWAEPKVTVTNPNPPAHMPGCDLIAHVDKPETPEKVQFDFYLMMRAMYKLWLLEDEDVRQDLDDCPNSVDN